MKVELTISNDNATPHPTFITVVEEAMTHMNAAVEAYHVRAFNPGEAGEDHDYIAQHMGNMLGNLFSMGITSVQYCMDCKVFTAGDHHIFHSPCDDHERIELYIDVQSVKDMLPKVTEILYDNPFFEAHKVMANEYLINDDREVGLLAGIVECPTVDSEEDLYDDAQKVCDRLEEKLGRKFFADVQEPVGRFFKLYIC